MTFSEFKIKNRYTHADLAEMFGISKRSVAYWLKDKDMLVVGRAGKRRVIKKPPKEIIYAVEQPWEAV